MIETSCTPKLSVVSSSVIPSLSRKMDYRTCPHCGGASLYDNELQCGACGAGIEPFDRRDSSHLTLVAN